MLIRQILLSMCGISFGVVVAGGLFSFIIGLGVISDFADRTHTGRWILLYETCVLLGGIVGGVSSVYRIPAAGNGSFLWLLLVFGLFGGIFTGCWAMALAEVLNVFPIFLRRTKAVRYLFAFIVAIAVGKGCGSLVYFICGM